MKFKTTLLLVFLVGVNHLFAQTDTTKVPSFFSGQITATNNGVSLIPSFSLGKPAVLFDLSIGKGRLSFDPMFRFGMDGKPWAFIFWWRYKAIQQKNFKMSVGAHPAFVFRSEEANINGVNTSYLKAQRFFAWEATPTLSVHKNIAFGISYLGSTGLTKDVIQSTTFVAFKTVFSNLSLHKNWQATIIPQFFYLKMDDLDGTYLSGSLILSKKKSPFTLTTIFSKKLRSALAGDDLLWSVGLNYNFNHQFRRIN
ncbi:hypothetical protein [Aquirufa salirivi]|uniref:DUF3575 domain-containing protein n=1 Tax=Aquirufa salirivi TaxID=3104729 RepID=A0ABW8RUB1_9BACT